MTLQQLKCFIIVARCRNFTKAADVLYISQPAVSKNVSELEKEWGVLLFDREQNPLGITPAGQFALSIARSLLQQAENLSDTMMRMGNHESNLSIIMNNQVSLLLYPTLISQFEKENPDIRVKIIEVQEHADQRLKSDPAADVALLPNVRQLLDPEQFIRKELFSTEYVIIAGKDTAMAKHERITADVVADLPVIADYCPRDLYAEHFVPQRLASFLRGKSIQIFSSQISVETQLVVEGKAYSYMFRESANRIPRIVTIPLEPSWVQKINLCYPKYKSEYPAIKRFSEFVCSFDYSCI